VRSPSRKVRTLEQASTTVPTRKVGLGSKRGGRQQMAPAAV